MRLSTKVLFLVVAVIFGIGAGSLFLASQTMRQALEDELLNQARAAAQLLADRIANEVIDGDVVESRRAVMRLVERSPSIAYAYITDFDGRIFTHSFNKGFPRELLPDNNQARTRADGLRKASHLDTGDGFVLEVDYPLIEGMTAHAHIGMDQSPTRELIGSLRNRIVVWTLGLAALFIVAGIVTSRRITRPLTELTSAMQAFGAGRVGQELQVGGGSREVSNLTQAFNRMIADRRHAMDELQQSQHLLLTMADNFPNSFASVIEPDRTISFTSGQEYRNQGLDPARFQGASLDRVFGDKAPMLRKYCERTFAGDECSFELEFNNQLHLYQMVPLRAEDGSIPQILLVAENITERVKTELALRRSQKMEAIGQMAGGIAHDFNNILHVIIGNIHLLRSQVGDDEKAQKRIQAIDKSSQRAADLTGQLLGFSRRRAVQTVVTNVNDLIVDMDALILRSSTPEVEINHNIADALWRTEIDPGDFQDAILNLVINARDAMPDGGRLLISTRNCELDDAFCAINPGARPVQYIQLSVSDTGTGISEEHLDHIFEPFFSTKPAGDGTGLGLAMVYGFIQRSHGFIKVESEPGTGTVFHLFLPRASTGAAQRGDVAEASSSLPGGNESILVVDDEPALLDLANDTLTALGYRVMSAGNGQSALESLRQYPTIDVLFTDVVMPGGISGFELAEQALSARPDLKILLTSGYAEKSIAKDSHRRFSDSVLYKPYTQSELAYRLRDLLDGTEVAAPTTSKLG
ncbi:MAG: ATP-binding protein [Xanthomonadales bacterium]|nr:ATP-binding protein [Xanthomonadales bacterium]